MVAKRERDREIKTLSRPTPEIPTPTPPPPSSVDRILIKGFRGDDSEYVPEASLYREVHIWQAIFYKYVNVAAATTKREKGE